MTLHDLFNAGTQKASLGKMQTRAELYELQDYAGYEARDQAYFK